MSCTSLRRDEPSRPDATGGTNQPTDTHPPPQGINLTLPVAASMKSLRRPPLVMVLGVCGFATIVAVYAGCVRI